VSKFEIRAVPEGLDLQGHRGCRGLLPENTVPGFLYAMDLGVTTLEMDVVITKDLQVLVSHDPFMSHEFCLKPDGSEIRKDEEMTFNIFDMTYQQVSQWDCGWKQHPHFPKQKKMKVHKPLLNEVLETTIAHGKKSRMQDVFYNIEVKSAPVTDDLFHPRVDLYCRLLMDELEKHKILKYTTIQSFDKRALQYINNAYPKQVHLSFLFEKGMEFMTEIETMGFDPDILSPDFELVDTYMMQYAKDRKMRVVPWTVNALSYMKQLIGMGVSGMISDYPDLYKQL
jgi:glycerophosphoryl diester phosphodiesterase